MKLKSKNSFLKRISCIALSLMLCLTSFTLAGFVPTLEAEAATVEKANVEVFHYTFDNYTLSSSGAATGTLTDPSTGKVFNYDGWNTTAYGSVQSNSDNFHHQDGGVYCDGLSLSGNNWTFTYIGRSQQDLSGTGQSASCEIGLGNSNNNPNIIRVSSHGYVYSNGTQLTTVPLLNNGSNNTITFTYNSGKLSINVNGTDYGQFDVDANLFSNVTSLNSGYISGYGSHDHYIYDIIATTSVDAYTLLTEKMREFENKLQTGKIYTNISNAYTAYVEASKAYDSYYYGGDTSIQLATYAENLNEAVNSMEEWTFARKYANNNKGIWMKNNDSNPMPFNDSYTPSPSSTGLGETHTYYTHQNILYAGIANKDFASLSGSTMVGWLRYQPITMMYDGDTLPQAPIMVVYGSSGSNVARYTLAITLTDDNGNSLKLVNKWLFSRDSSYAANFDWSSAYKQQGNGDNCISQSLPGSPVQLGKSGWFGWTTTPGMANLYNFDGSFSNNEYLKTITPTINFHTNDTGSSTDINIPQNFTASGDTSTPETDYRIHVINYKAVIDAAGVYKKNANLKFDVTKYREGGLKTHIDKINDVGNSLNFNPNDYFNSATSSSNAGKNNYQGCANKISEICTSVNNVNNNLTKIIEDNKDQYPALRKAMDNAMSTYKAGRGNYTYRSYNQFKTKYEYAQKLMQDVITWGYIDGSFAQTAAENLTKAYNNLETPKANITFENLFSFEDFYNSASATDKTNRGTATYDRNNKTILVKGDGDNYTDFSLTSNTYKIPVTPGKSYTFKYTPSTDYSYVMLFFPNADESGSDPNYYQKDYCMYHGSANTTISKTFTVDDGKNYVFFRFGTSSTEGVEVECEISKIAFYEAEREAERGNLTELGVTEISVTPGQEYGDLPSPTREGYVFDGWYTDKEFTNQVTSTTIAVASQTAVNLYAKWHAHNFENQITMSQTGNSYTWTGECTCGATQELSKVDASAYLSAVAAARTDIANTVKYSSPSIADLQKVLDDNNLTFTKEHVIYQADVETATKNIILADQIKTENNKGVLVLEKYSIKFNVASVDGKTLATNITGTGTYDYGTMVELDLPEQYQTNYVVTTWKRYAKGEDKVVGGTSTKLYVIVNQESTYTAVINSVATDNVGDNEAVLTLNNKSGKTIDVGFVETNKEQTVTVDINNSTVTIGSVELTAPTYSFYTLKGFYIDKTLYSESGGTVTITKDTVITPYYDASLFVNINRASGETFTINGDNKESYPANWNQKVTLKSKTEVYWYDDNDVLLGKGTTYSFYANSEVTIHTEPVDLVQNVDPTASIGYFNYDSTLNKVTVVNNFFVPDGMKVTKAGVILSTKNSTREALIAQTNGKFEGGTESFTSTGNQIRISVSRTAKTSFTMYALAYVVTDDGQTYYAPTVRSITYTATKA